MPVRDCFASLAMTKKSGTAITTGSTNPHNDTMGVGTSLFTSISHISFYKKRKALGSLRGFSFMRFRLRSTSK